MPAVNPGTTGLVEWWSLDEASGSRAGSHAGLTLTDNNTVGSAAGVLGNAASFAAASSEWLSSSSASIQPGTGDFSAVCWVKPATNFTTDGVGGGRIIQRRGQGGFGTVAGWQFAAYRTGTNVYVCNTGVDDGAGNSVISGSSTAHLIATTAGFSLVALTWDSAADTLRVYSNAALVATYTGSTGVGSLTQSGRDFTFGATQTGAQAVDGEIDEGSFWTRLLTVDHLEWLYNSGAGRAYSALASGAGLPVLQHWHADTFGGGW